MEREPALFLHFESESFTAKVKLGLGLDAGLQYFLRKLEERRGVKVDAGSSRVEVRDEQTIIDAAKWQSLPDKTDLFVTIAPSSRLDEKLVSDLMASKNYKKAAELLTKSGDASWALAEILRLAGKHDDAIRMFKVLLRDSQSRVDSMKVYLGLGLSLSAAGRRREAIEALRRADGKNPDVATALGFAYLACDEVEEAVDVIENALGMKRRTRGDDASNAAVVVETGASLVGPTRAYAACAAHIGQFDEELRILLQASVASQGDADVRRDLGRALDRPGACLRLEKQIGSAGATTAAAFGYLAIVAKDNGAVSTAVTLLEWACDGDPDSSNYALNLMHALEIVADSGRALEVGTGFIRRRRGDNFADACLSALEENPESREIELVWRDDGYARVAGEELKIREKTVFDAHRLDFLAIGFVIAKILYLRGDLLRAARLVAEIEPFRHSSAVALHTTSIRNENAYYGCLAQILAAEKEGKEVPERRRRNPQTSSSSDDGTGSIDSWSQIYVCGDSHALSPAWKRWHLDGVDVELRPALVTGLKHWHLRPESVFYPKRNFYSMVGLETSERKNVSSALGLGKISYANRLDEKDVVPDHSIVVFVLGEIDCREGILVAIQKLRYRNIEEGIDKTSLHFVKAAEIVAREKKLRKAFVHPVPPVLDETRAIVIMYNARLKVHVDNSEHLHWLDFFEGFLELNVEGSAGAPIAKLKPKYNFDGTHLNPAYLDDLLLPSLQKHRIEETLKSK